MLILSLLLLGLAAPVQTTSDRLPPANPIAYSDDGGAAVLTTFRALVAALDAGNAAEVAAATRSEGMFATSIELTSDDGLRQTSWAQVAGAAATRTRETTRLADVAVEVDGRVAMVWAPYTTRSAVGAVTCGVLHGDLVDEGSGWRVLHLTRSVRYTGCAAS